MRELRVYTNQFIAGLAILLVMLIFWLLPGIGRGAVLLIYTILMLLMVAGTVFLDKVKDNSILNLEKNIQKFSKNSGIASSQIASVARQLYLTIDDNNVFSEELFSQTREMSSLNKRVCEEVDVTLTDIKEIALIQENANLVCSDLEQNSVYAKNVLKDSQKAILEVVNIIEEIQKSSDNTSKGMEDLEGVSVEISNILDKVTTISRQTRILALNATIESARAGMAGKGFSVISDQIRKLSVETNQAVEDINSLIFVIKNEVQKVQAVVKTNNDNIIKSVSNSRNVEASLDNIDQSYTAVLNLVGSIYDLSEKEVMLTRGISDKIVQVEEMIKDSSTSASKVYSSVNKQKESISEITGMSNRLNKSSEELVELYNNNQVVKMKINSSTNERIKDHQQKIETDLKNDLRIYKMNTSDHTSLLNEFLENNSFIEAAWTNDNKGRFIVSIPESGIVNASVRDWFEHSSKGEDFVSDIYFSAITHNPCITISSAITNKKNEIIGVVGFDLKVVV